MSPGILFVSLLIGPQANPPAQVWRDEYASIMRVTTNSAKPDPQTAVPRLVHYHGIVTSVDALANSERTRMRKAIELRLISQWELLNREQKRLERKTAARTANSLEGGASLASVQSLIQVIVSTVSPDSWQSRGGKGSITYYDQNPALVIRQTQAAHDEISAVLKALR